MMGENAIVPCSLASRPAVSSLESRRKLEPYQHLDLAASSIRLFDLSPGRWNDKLSATFRVVDLKDRPAYDALSYTWGRQQEQKGICINKKHGVGVMDNLFRALRRLRRRFGTRTLWVDAICIDQSDVQKRGQQVSLMGQIYRQASTVLVWLGEYPDASSLDTWLMRRPHWTRRGHQTLINSRGKRFGHAINLAIRNTQPRWSDRAWVPKPLHMTRSQDIFKRTTLVLGQLLITCTNC